MISKLLPLTYAPLAALRNVTIAFILMGMPALAEPVTLVALGDSLTEGYGLPPDQGLVPQLQAWLTTQGAEVTVVNAGVSGDTTAGGVSRLDWTLTPDVDAVIVTLGGNDMLRGIDPATSRANLETILQGITARGLPFLLVSMQAPGNYGPDYKAEFDAIYPELAAAAPFYGSAPAAAAVPNIGAAVFGVYGELDTRLNASIPDLQAALDASGKTYSMKIYANSPHAFHNDTGQSYNRAAAVEAYVDTLNWFGEHLGLAPGPGMMGA